MPGHANLALGATDPLAAIQDANEEAKRFGNFGDFSRPFDPSQGNPFAHPGIDPTNPLFPADDGFKPRDETKVGREDGQQPVDTNPFTNGTAERQPPQAPILPGLSDPPVNAGGQSDPFAPSPFKPPEDAAKPVGERVVQRPADGVPPDGAPASPAPAHAEPAAPAPQVRTETDKAKQAEARRQAEEALDNLTFFKGMQTRVAALCKEHGLDASDMAPLSNLFRDAAVTSMNHLAKATEAATGQKLDVDDPLFVNAMKLAREADPLEGDGSNEEGSEGTFDLKSGPAPAPAPGEKIDHSIGLLPSDAQPAIKQAAVKAEDLVASRSEEGGSAIDLGPLPTNHFTDLGDPDDALSELSEDDDLGPAPQTLANETEKTIKAGSKHEPAAGDPSNDASAPFLEAKLLSPIKALKRLVQTNKVEYVGGEDATKTKSN